MAQEKELKQILEKLHTVIKTTSEFSREQVKINRDLLKVMSLINDGFAKNADDAKVLIQDITDGVEDVDKFFEKWAKDRGATKKDLEEIRRKFKEIEDIDDDIVENSKDFIDLLKERHNLLEDEVDLGQSLLTNHIEILKVVRESKRQYANLGGSFSEINDSLKKIVAKKVDFNSMFGDTNLSLESVRGTLAKINTDIDGLVQNVSGNYFDVDLNFNPLTGDLDKEVQMVLKAVEDEKNARIDGLVEYFQKNKQLQTQLGRQLASQFKGYNLQIDVDTGNIQTANGILKKGTLEFQKMADKLDLIAKKNDLLKELEGTFQEIANLTKLGSLRTEEQTQELYRLLKPMGLANELLIEQLSHQQDLLSADSEHLLKQKEILKTTSKYIGQLKGAESIVMKVGAGFDYINSILPAGIGEFIGLGRVSQDLIDSHKKGVQEFATKLGEGVKYSEALQGYFQAFKPALLSAVNPVTILLTTFVLLYKFTESLVNKYKDMAQEMKISLGQAKNLLDTQLDTLTSQKNQFAQLKDIQAVQSAMIGSSGKVFDLTNKGAKELSINLVEVGKYFGYGNEQAVALHKTFNRLGADDKLSLTLQKNLGYMSEMAGISPQIVAQDLVDNAEIVSTYFAGMPDKAAKAAIQVRRMGLSLQQAGSIAQKMLNLDDFMTDMYELYAMTGRGIDFSGAFDKGLMGDIEGMTKDIMDQIGTTAELDKMDYLTRTKLAKTLGMSVDELAKSVKLHEDMQGLDKKDQDYLQANLDRMGDISRLNKEDIKNRLAQLQSTDRLTVAWEKIKGVLFKALIPLAEAFADAIDYASPIIDLLILGFKGIADVLKVIGPLVKIILAPFKLISDWLSKITGSLDEMADGVNGFAKPISEVLKLSMGLFEVWAGFKLLKWTGILNKDLFGMFKTIPLFGKLFGSLSKQSQVSATESSVAIQQITKSNIDAQVQQVEQAKSTLSEVASTTAQSTTKMSKEVDQAVEKTKKNVSKPTKLGLISSDGAKKGFKLFGEIASKAFAGIAIHAASSFLFMKKDGEEKASDLADNMQSVFGMALSGIAPMLLTTVQDSIEKTFSKRLEKRIETTLEKPIKNASKAFGGVEREGESSFKKLITKGKNLFKKLTLGPNLTGSFSAMADQATEMTSKVESVQEVVEKVKKTTSKPVSDQVKPIKEPDVKKPIKKVESQLGGGFDSLKSVLTQVWSGLKTVLTDVVKFISQTMKELSSGIGTTIKNLLKGIGDGLSSFKTSAVKGAAALVIVSGALWITSKAVKNFNEVSWDDLAKAGIALGGLVAVSLLLGSASSKMIIGAIGIAALGASLIPAAFALNKFNDVDWNSLAKAGVALIGLGVVGGILGTMAPMMLLGSLSIAALGASLIPLAISMKMFQGIDWDTLKVAGIALVGFGLAASAFGLAAPLILAGSAVIGTASISIGLFSGALLILNSSIKDLNIQPLKEAGSEIIKLTSIPFQNIIAISGAITTLGLSLLSFQSMISAGNIGTQLSKLFGGDVISDLERLGKIADPLSMVADAVGVLSSNLVLLMDSLQGLNLDKIKSFDMVANVQEKVSSVATKQPNQNIQLPSPNVKISPIQPQVVNPLPPAKESVAQNERLNPKQIAETQIKLNNQKKEDTYNNQTDFISDFKNMEDKLDQMVYLLSLLVKKDMNSYMDAQKVNSVLKGINNH